MRNIISITLLFLGSIVYGQQQIVFVVDSNMADNIRFSTRDKYRPTDFYTEKQLIIDRSEDGLYYSITISEPSVITVAMPPALYQEVYLNVEDTIHISESNSGDYLLFKGKNTITDSQYNYHNEEQQWQRENRSPFYKKGTSLEEHKGKVTDWIQAKRTYFHNYFNENTVHEDFRTFFTARCDCEYTFLLLFPLRSGVTDFPENYMDGTIRGNYNSRLFVVASPLYIEWFREIKRYDLPEMKKHIYLHFTGDTMDYLLSLMMGIYADGMNVDSAEFLKCFDDLEQRFVRRDYVDYMEGAKEYYMKSLTRIPDSILMNTHVETMNSEVLNFHSLLEEHKDKYIVLDFWASWCGPCIKDIKESAEIKGFLSQNDVVYIYVSIDTHRDKWVSASNDLGISSHQFRMMDNKNAPLLSYLQINSIPRYVFLDKKTSIINLNGKSPIKEHINYYKETFNK